MWRPAWLIWRTLGPSGTACGNLERNARRCANSPGGGTDEVSNQKRRVRIADRKPDESWNTEEGRRALGIARSAMGAQLAKWSPSGLVFAEWEATASERLQSRPVPPEGKVPAYARRVATRVAQDWWRTKKRRDQLTGGDQDTIGSDMLGGSSSAEKEQRRFSREEESALRDAVIEYCETEYRKSWGKDWNPEAIWREVWREKRPRNVLDLMHKIERQRQDIQLEQEATKALDSIMKGPLPQRRPLIGGSEYELLWEVRQLITKRRSQRRLLKGQWDSSSCHRFVAYARWNPIFQNGLGVWRGPEDGVPFVPVRPDADELTVLWLLAGGWPKINPLKWPPEGITKENLVKRRMKPTIEAAIKALGEQPEPESPGPQATTVVKNQHGVLVAVAADDEPAK